MASSINASNTGAGGVITTADASGVLNLQGGGVTGISIDASGNTTTTTPSQASNNTRVPTTAYIDRVAVQQIANTVTGAVATGTTQLPYDDTIPQSSEGDQYMTLAITPKSATSKLLIHVTWIGASTSGAQFTVALFQDSTANALAAATVEATTSTQMLTITFSYIMVSGTTSSTTFKVRAGGNGAGTTTFNGRSSARTLGGVNASSIIIEEIGI